MLMFSDEDNSEAKDIVEVEPVKDQPTPSIVKPSKKCEKKVKKLTKREKKFVDTVADQLCNGEKVNLAKASRSSYSIQKDPKDDSSKGSMIVRKERVLAGIADVVDDYAKECVNTISQSQILTLACESVERDLQSQDPKVVRDARAWVMEACKHFTAVKERLESLTDKSPKHLHLPRRS